MEPAGWAGGVGSWAGLDGLDGKAFCLRGVALSPKAAVGSAELNRFRGVCRAGIERRADLAQDEGEKEYLTRCIRYSLGPEEKEGLGEFAKLSGIPGVEIDWL